MERPKSRKARVAAGVLLGSAAFGLAGCESLGNDNDVNNCSTVLEDPATKRNKHTTVRSTLVVEDRAYTIILGTKRDQTEINGYSRNIQIMGGGEAAVYDNINDQLPLEVTIGDFELSVAGLDRAIEVSCS